MRVLLVGATGRLGSRLVPALVAHKHSVVAYVRNPSKLAMMIPQPLLERIIVVTGDGEDVSGLKKALIEHSCEAVICCAGKPAPIRKGDSRVGEISMAIAQAAREVGEETGRPLKGWWLAGLIFLKIPGSGKTFHDYWSWFGTTYDLAVNTITSIPLSSLRWSILCPSKMTITSTAISSAVDGPPGNSIVLGADSPPLYQPSWLMLIPIIGIHLEILRAASSHRTTLEDVADRLAEDLAEAGGGEQWDGKLVGVKNVPGAQKKTV
ncbi:hypothetical protein FRB96_001478 [Tulasnella sp. 330]|nr:hypothetical protein FRB96_001478 [Tulasnella sp. 330]KAG8886650.1 hypothetical protein FRB97_000070 [Tulasnella sp. 331]KAG8890655.1 hypothetical protein FRB98_006158 [Tulasnella sp. 332]